MRREDSQHEQIWKKIQEQYLAEFKESWQSGNRDKTEDQDEKLENLIEKFQEEQQDFSDLIAQIIGLFDNSPLSRSFMAHHLYRWRRLIHHILTEELHLTEEQLNELDQTLKADQEVRAKEQERLQNLATMPYPMYLKTPHWNEQRLQALQRAKNRCQLCNATRGLEVHHKTYERRGKERPEDLIVLCGNCHGKFHNKLAQNER